MADAFLQIVKWILFFAGMNPHKQNFVSYAIFVINISMMASMAVLSVVGAVTNWENIESLGQAEVAPGFTRTSFAMVMFLLNMKTLRIIFANFAKFWPAERFPVEFQVKIAKIHLFNFRLCVAYFCQLLTAGVAFNTLALMDWELAFSIFTHCNLTNKNCYFGYFIYQLCCMLLIVVVTGSLEIFFVYCIHKVYCELECVKFLLTEIKIGEDEEEAMRSMFEIVDHHGMVLETIKHVSQMYDKIMLFQYWSTTASITFGFIMMCIAGIPPDLNRFSKYSTLICALSAQLFVYCLGGTILAEQSLTVSDVAFETKWWLKTQPKVRMALVLLIQRSHRVGKLTIGGMIDLNLQVFAIILKTSLSVFTLVQKMVGKESFSI